MTEEARRGVRTELRWAHTTPRCGPHPGRAQAWCGGPGSHLTASLRIYRPLITLSRGETPQKYSSAAAKRKTTEREKLSGRQKSAGEIPFRRGKSSPSSPSSSWTSSGSSSSTSLRLGPTSPPSPRRPAVTFWVESCLVHRGNFPGVDYSLQLMLLSETIGLRFMSRLLFTIISPLIMIHMMSCEQFVQFLRTWEKS